MNNRQRMRASNKLAVDYLLKHQYDHIYLKPHAAFPDTVYFHTGTKKWTDFFNLFDGFCLSASGRILWFQIKTNRWPAAGPIRKFTHAHDMNAAAINIRTPTKTIKRFRVDIRFYQAPYYT